jgi:Ca2+-binding RTX toxin-like protein
VVLRASRPSATVDDVSITEGNAGTKQMTFTVTQSDTLLTASSVSAQSADGSAVVAGPAVGGSDYEATSGTVTIPFGATTGTFSVPVKGDEIYEHDDTLTVGLTSPDNLTLADASATGTISNDEATPRLVAGSLGVVEKDSGATTNSNVPVSLTPVSAFTTTVDWTTAPGSASASDYNAAGGTLTFLPGVPSRNAVVPIVGDFTTEDDETVQVNLSNPTVAGDAVLGESGVLTIRDDDAAVSVSDVTVDEPVSGTTLLTFTATLSHVNPRIVGFDWATSDGTAVAPGDYLAGSGSSTIAVGQLTRRFTVTINPDTLSEGDETFFTILSAITGGQPGRTNATMTIKDNRCTILGTAGNDDLWGTTGNDVICGLAGNDTIHPGPGNDEVYGGSAVPSPTAPDAGKDTVDYSRYKPTADKDLLPVTDPVPTSCGEVTVDLFKAQATGSCHGTDQVWNMDNITGTEFDDTLRGNAKPNTLQGNGGNDMLLGDAGDDILVGGADNACSAATVFCGDAVSYVRLVDPTGVNAPREGPENPAPSVTVTLSKTVKQNTGGAGSDTIQGVESLFGTNSDDTLTGNNFASTISGLAGDDVIHGLAGNDTLFGNDGHDVVHGDAAVDRVFGGDGDDIVNGDAGVDLAVDGEAGDDIVFGGDGDESKGGRIRGGDGLHDFCHDGDVGSPVFSYEGSGCENS